MINRIEINKFAVNVGDITKEATVPFSLDFASKDANGNYNGNDHRAKASARFSLSAGVDQWRFSYLMMPPHHHIDAVYLNGREIVFEKENTARYYSDVKYCLRSGENTLDVFFDISLGENDSFDNVGVFFAPVLTQFNTALINDVSTAYFIDSGTLTVNIKLFAVGDCEGCRAVATLESPAGQYYYAAVSDGEGQIVITDPLLWSCRTVGVPNLYKLSVTLYNGEEAEDGFECVTGFRSIDATEKIPLINQKPFAIRGAACRIDSEACAVEFERDIEKLVVAASSSGVNTLLLKGGVLPSSRFFYVCDKYGVAVIVEGVVDECTLTRHPSIIAVFGAWGMTYSHVADSASAPWDYEIIELPNALPTFDQISRVVPLDEMSLFSKRFERGDGFNVNLDLIKGIAEEYRFTTDMRRLTYLSGVFAGEYILRQTATRDRAFCPNVIVSAFNSTSGLVSDGLVDMFGVPKPALYFLRTAYSDCQVFADYRDGVSEITVCNNSASELRGLLHVSLMTADNSKLAECRFEVSVSGGADARFDASELFVGKDVAPDYSYITCELSTASGVAARSTALLSKTKHFRFVDPCLSVRVVGNDRSYTLTVTAEKFAHRVQLGFDGVYGEFSDNYFDVTKDAPIRISFTAEKSTTAELLAAKLRVTSMYDLDYGIYT